MSLAAAMLRGSGWQSIATASTTVGQLAVAIVLARLLRPEDFGLVAIGFASTELLGVLGEFGAAAAVARTKAPSRSQVRRLAGRTALAGGILAAVAIGIGTVLERWFAMPHLAAVMTALAAATAVSNVGLVFQAIAEAELDFRRIAIVDSLSYWTGALVLSIPLAALGFSHWALVIGFAGQGVVRLISHAPLLSGLPPTGAEAADGPALRSFGGRLTIARLLNAGVNQLDKFVLGRRTDAADVGLYSRPMLLVTQISTAAGAIYDRVLYPVFARLSHDAESMLNDHFLRAAAFIALVLTPVSIFVATESTALVDLLFGAQWGAAAGVLRWGALALPGLAVVRVCDTLARAVGRPGRSVILKAVYLVLLMPALLFGVRGGPVGVGAAVSVVATVMALIQVSDAVRTAGGRASDLARVGWRVAPLLIGLAGAVALAAMARQSLPELRPIAAIGISAVAAALAASVVLAIDGRVGGRALAWLLAPFRAHLPGFAIRLIGRFE